MIRRPLLPIRQYLLDRMVLRPTRHPIDHSHQHRELLEVGSRKLECFIQRSFEDDGAPDLLVLKFPGTAGRAERSTGFPMSIMESQRVEVWTWNPPGYGRSEGRASLKSIADAALGFWEHVTRRVGGSDVTTWLCGNSLGCVSALHVAASMNPDIASTGLLLRNPPPLVSVVKRVAQSYPMGSFLDFVAESLCDSMNAMTTANQVKLPAVFLQSELDSLVPPEFQNQLIANYGGEYRLVVLDGLEHGCVATEDQWPRISQSIHWLWEQTRCHRHVCSR
jgi:pimeloyl-ACP methyl ester carboxylesterase